MAFLAPAPLLAGVPLFRDFEFGDAVAEISAQKVPLFECPHIAQGHYCAAQKVLWLGQEMDLSFSTKAGKITEVVLMYVQDQSVELAYKQDLIIHRALLADYGLLWVGRGGGEELDLMQLNRSDPEEVTLQMSRFLQQSYERSPAFLRIWVAQKALFKLSPELPHTPALLASLPRGASVVRQQWLRDGTQASGLLVFTAAGLSPTLSPSHIK
ncbi:MAG: hypothetical protein RRB13_09200 [bacterium]|nr:hypothetical protein [bacterium]